MTLEDMLNAALARIRTISATDAAAEVADGTCLLVDLREAQERTRDGSIRGARSVPRGMIEFWAAPDSPYYKQYFQADRRTLLFCAGGLRSALAADALQNLGYTNVAHIDGGFESWQTTGLPTVAIDERNKEKTR